MYPFGIYGHSITAWRLPLFQAYDRTYGASQCPLCGTNPQLVTNHIGLYRYQCPNKECDLHDGPPTKGFYRSVPHNYTWSILAAEMMWNRAVAYLAAGYRITDESSNNQIEGVQPESVMFDG